jgi:hypothetical protein
MKRAPNQPETVSVSVYAGIYMKVYRVPDADTLIPQHSHKFPHLTALLQGRVRVWREDGDDDGPREYCAPSVIRIPAHAMHSFLTLTPVVLACIHNADHLEADEPAVAAEHHLDFEEN